MWCVPVAMEHLVFYAKRICDILGRRPWQSLHFIPFRRESMAFVVGRLARVLLHLAAVPGQRMNGIRFRPSSFAYIFCSCQESIITPPLPLLNPVST